MTSFNGTMTMLFPMRVDGEDGYKAVAAAVAARLRRKTVTIGPAVTPGVCPVINSRGNVLGYVDLWGGWWNGRIYHSGTELLYRSGAE